MTFTLGMLNCLIPITQFNKGQATRIFDRLRTEHPLIVLKNNTPSAVILSSEEFARLSEIEEDYSPSLFTLPRNHSYRQTKRTYLNTY